MIVIQTDTRAPSDRYIKICKRPLSSLLGDQSKSFWRVFVAKFVSKKPRGKGQDGQDRRRNLVKFEIQNLEIQTYTP